MRINKEGETVIFEYERKHLKPGDKKRIVSAYKEHRAALSRSQESGVKPEDELRLLLAHLARTAPEQIDQAEIERLKEELGAK